MDQKQFEAMVKGTVLAEAMDVNLVDVVAPDDKVKNKDAVLGVMNDLEKRLYFLAHQKQGSFAAICADCTGDKDDKDDDVCRQSKEFKRQSKQIAELMWKLIEIRLGSGSMSIQEGFQIELIKDYKSGGTHIIELGFGGGFSDPLDKLKMHMGQFRL